MSSDDHFVWQMWRLRDVALGAALLSFFDGAINNHVCHKNFLCMLHPEFELITSMLHKFMLRHLDRFIPVNVKLPSALN